MSPRELRVFDLRRGRSSPAGRRSRQLIAVRVRGAPRVLSFPGGRVYGWSR